MAPAERARLVETMEAAMLANPGDWQRYYHGTPEEKRLLRVYSYSDRLRYYWNSAEVQAAVDRLLHNLEKTPIPETLLSQYCPRQYEIVRAGMLENKPKELVIATSWRFLVLTARLAWVCTNAAELLARRRKGDDMTSESRPLILLDPHPRPIDLIFDAATKVRLVLSAKSCGMTDRLRPTSISILTCPKQSH